MKPIGPTFTTELEAAGLLGLPFSWRSDGKFEYGSSITRVQQTAIEDVYQVHNPMAKPVDPEQVKQARIDAATDLNSLKELLKELL